MDHVPCKGYLDLLQVNTRCESYTVNMYVGIKFTIMFLC